MTNLKQHFQKFCKEEKNIPLFLKYEWFKNLYKDSDWGVCVALRGVEVVGLLPYVISKKKSFKLITPQLLSPYQGVWIKYPKGQKNTTKLSFEKDVISELINQLPKIDAFKQNFYPTFKNWLPFYWHKFKQTTRYTYVVDLKDNEQGIFLNFKENIRREIRKAEKSLHIEKISNIDLLYQMKQNVYTHSNENYPIPKRRLEKAFNFCQKNNCGELLVAKDNFNQIHSILFYVWDSLSAYYLHGVTDLKYKTSGSMSLLLWEAIKLSKNKTKQFNFEGSMVESIERYFRAFGGEQTPYFQISKNNSKVLKLINF